MLTCKKLNLEEVLMNTSPILTCKNFGHFNVKDVLQFFCFPNFCKKKIMHVFSIRIYLHFSLHFGLKTYNIHIINGKSSFQNIIRSRSRTFLIMCFRMQKEAKILTVVLTVLIVKPTFPPTSNERIHQKWDKSYVRHRLFKV